MPDEIKSGKFNKGISKDEGLQLFKQDAAIFIKSVNDKTKVFVIQNEFDALVSFAFQQGQNAKSLKDVIALVNEGKIDEAAKLIKNTGNKNIEKRS